MKRIAAFVAALSLLYAGCGGTGAGLSSGDATPRLILSTGSLDLHAMLTGAVEQGTVTVTLQSVASFTAADAEDTGGDWCSTSILGSTLTIFADPSVPPGTGVYTATVTVSDPSGDAADQLIAVTFTVHEWTFVPDPPDVVFAPVAEGSMTPQTSNVTVTTAPAQDWTAAVSNELPSAGWCSVTAGGVSGGTLAVTADPTGLTINTYTATVTVSSPGMDNATFTVEFEVQPPSGIFPDDLTMYFSLKLGYPAATQSTIVNVYSPTEDWAATDNQTWCVVTAGGTSGGQLDVTVNAGLAVGTYSALVTVTSASHPTAYIDVYVGVSAAGQWAEMTTPTMENLYGIHGTASNDVFAVGGGGVVVRYNGSNWTEMVHGLTTEALRDVWCVDASNIFAVGANGTILHCDGTTWTTMASGVTAQLNAVWGSAANDVYAGGENLTLLHYSGTDWQSAAAGTGDVYGLNGSASDDVWSVGPGRIDYYDGSIWDRVWPHPDTQNRSLYGVFARTASDVWATGFGGAILNYDGSSWSEFPFTSSVPADPARFLGVWASSATDAFAVGTRNDPSPIAHYDGIQWSPGDWTTGDFWDVYTDICGFSATDVFVSCWGGIVLHYGP